MRETITWERDKNAASALRRLAIMGRCVVSTHRNSESIHPATARRMVRAGFAKFEDRMCVVSAIGLAAARQRGLVDDQSTASTGDV
jgi:hypothetical protein